MKHSILLAALVATLGLAACEKSTVVVPPTPAATPAPVAVPGPPGPPGPPGEPGKPAPPSETTVIVTPAPAASGTR